MCLQFAAFLSIDVLIVADKFKTLTPLLDTAYLGLKQIDICRCFIVFKLMY